ncbi:MAG: hypothetical protein GY796_06430 [Chloroflexi bacterium]|nr:hypothetical protein [Chloroflexota bacterium]
MQSGTGDITVAGSWDNSAGGTFTHNGSGVTLDGVAQSVSGTTTFQRLITGGSGTKSFGASTVVIDERFTHGGGTMDGETSTFRFDGGGGTNLNGTNAKNFHNVIINASNVTHSAGNNFDVSGDFTVNDGASFLQTASGTKIVRFEGNGVQTITINGSGSASFRRMTVQSGAIVVLPDTGSTQPFVLASAITNNGAIRQTAASVSSSTNFVRICDDASCTTEQYIGMTINPTLGTPDLTVEIKGNTSVCNTNNGGVYRDRCYRVNASGAATVDITLYSTSGEDDITNDALYQYDGTGTSWTNRAACSDGVGAGGSCSASGISLASGDNYFLIGDSTNAPTAITLTTFTAQSAVHAPLAFLIGGAALLLVGGGMSALRRRIRR